MNDSRIRGFYKLDVADRIDELQRLGCICDADAELLRQGRHTLATAKADKMSENVVGVFGLPFAIAPNFIVNGQDMLVPMVVEEPSVVAAVSHAASMARATGGFTASCDDSLLIGQIHVSGMQDVDAALQRLVDAEERLLKECNAVHPRLLGRGGGVREIELRKFQLRDGTDVIAVHLLVDTCDAMGANLVNTICEAVAPSISELCKGDAVLRILSNLADRAVVTARVQYPRSALRHPDFSAEDLRDRIITASEIARVDPYRAATHNKGIMNGIDAVAIATGNDWRAIEAGAHAYAAISGHYGPLATWSANDNGDLVGEISIPLKVGIVGGNLDANSATAFSLRVCGVQTARELAQLMAAVGLAQNFGALRALAGSGIQGGHMKLHARSVASTAGASEEVFDEVVAELIAGQDISVSRATEIISARRAAKSTTSGAATAAGKVILLGEHGVVYGRHALALPIPNAVTATVIEGSHEPSIRIPEWGVAQPRTASDTVGIAAAIAMIEDRLGIDAAHFSIELHSRLPRAMGLGSSAAFAVAVARAFNDKLTLGLDDKAINAVAFECEKLAHGTPSGIDNTLATYARAMLFRNDDQLESEVVAMPSAAPIVIACSGQPGLTREQVAGVGHRHAQSSRHYDAIFDEMDALSQAGAAALAESDYAQLGQLMNICHGLLNAIEVSTAEIEEMVSLARSAGASGAKLTGGGGGGSIVALCPGTVGDVQDAFAAAGYKTVSLD